MTIEEKVFERRKFIPEKLLQYGFYEVDDGYEYKTDFRNGEFQASIFVTKEGKASGKVIDVMNNEEYSRLRAENCSDSYVISVQNAYIELLTSIAEYCCKILPFASAQANRIMEKIFQKYKVEPDFPWAKKGGFKNYKNYGVFRHKDTKKWFAIIMDISWHSLLKNKNFATVDIINLKVEFVEYFKGKGIYPAYHMDQENWISIILDETLEDDVITNLIDLSFNVTNEK
jgi:hypothetical protein